MGPWHRPDGGTPSPHSPVPPPSRPASAARALDDRRASSPRGRLYSHERTQTTAIVSDTRKDRVHDGHTSRAAACSTTRRCTTRRCWSAAQSRTRRLVRQAPRTASLALSGAPDGRHQRSAMRTMHRSRSQTWTRSTSRGRGQDRQQLAVMNAGIRRLGNHGKRARRVRIRSSEQRLRARNRR